MFLIVFALFELCSDFRWFQILGHRQNFPIVRLLPMNFLFAEKRWLMEDFQWYNGCNDQKQPCPTIPFGAFFSLSVTVEQER